MVIDQTDGDLSDWLCQYVHVIDEMFLKFTRSVSKPIMIKDQYRDIDIMLYFRVPIRLSGGLEGELVEEGVL